VAGITRRPSYRMEWSQLRELEPEIVLIMPCGFTLAETGAKPSATTTVLAASRPGCTCSTASAYFSARARVSWTVLECWRRLYSQRESCFDTCDRPADLPLQRDLQDRASRDARLRGAECHREGCAPAAQPFGAALETLSEGVAQLYHKETRELQTLAAFDVVQLRRDLADDLGRLPAPAALSEVMLKNGAAGPLPAAYEALLLGLDALVTPSLERPMRWPSAGCGCWSECRLCAQLDACVARRNPVTPTSSHSQRTAHASASPGLAFTSASRPGEALIGRRQRGRRRHLQHHFGERGGAGKPAQVIREIASQLDDIERREASAARGSLCDRAARPPRSASRVPAEGAARPEHTLRDGTLHPVIARRETHDLGGPL